SSQRERPSRLSAASTKQRPRHLTHRPCASECKTSERACRRQSTGAPNTWQNCCGATSKDGLTESRPPESPDSETRRPAGKSAASVSPAPPGCCARAASGHATAAPPSAALPTPKDLFICVKDLLVDAMQVASTERNGRTPVVSGGSKEWAVCPRLNGELRAVAL